MKMLSMTHRLVVLEDDGGMGREVVPVVRYGGEGVITVGVYV